MSRTGNDSTLCTIPTGFTRFACTAVSLSETFGLPCSSLELLILLILSVFSPSQQLLSTLVLWPRLTPAAST
ncbi:MAG: hypothetical protein WCP19_15195 [Chloroflexota bacterium]